MVVVTQSRGLIFKLLGTGICWSHFLGSLPRQIIVGLQVLVKAFRNLQTIVTTMIMFVVISLMRACYNIEIIDREILLFPWHTAFCYNNQNDN